ncbi:MAG TPA: tetratricopeptide repeat protein [Nitrosopumilaceae archaeon]|nr:tetratricopeptide repeat protein [Nitrosopumilaceae archaeon]
MWNSVFVLIIGVILSLAVFSPSPSLAAHQSGVTWQLVVISSEPACSGYHHYMVEKYHDITEKYLDLYELKDSQYKPECYTEKSFTKEFEKPSDLDLLILVYDRDKGRAELHTQDVGGLYIHQGNDLSTKHTIIICDCPNFKYSDPVWILSHEISHFVLNFLGFDMNVVEKEIHGLDHKFDSCVEGVYDDLCTTVKTKIYTQRSDWVVMKPYEPAIGKEPPSPLVEKVSLESPIQTMMMKQITKWWLAGEISDQNYINSLNILSGKSNEDKIIPSGIFEDSSFLILSEAKNNIKNETLAEDTTLKISENINELNESIVKKNSSFSPEDEKVFLDWIEIKSSAWNSNQISDDEFISEIEKILDSSKIDLYLDYLDNLSVEELVSKASNYEKEGKFRNALSYYDRAIIIGLELEGDEINALIGKGSVLNSLGQYDSAIAYFDNVLEIEPDNIDALKKKAFTLSQLGQIEEAKKYFKIASQIKLK